MTQVNMTCLFLCADNELCMSIRLLDNFKSFIFFTVSKLLEFAEAAWCHARFIMYLEKRLHILAYQRDALNASKSIKLSLTVYSTMLVILLIILAVTCVSINWSFSTCLQ